MKVRQLIKMLSAKDQEATVIVVSRDIWDFAAGIDSSLDERATPSSAVYIEGETVKHDGTELPGPDNA